MLRFANEAPTMKFLGKLDPDYDRSLSRWHPEAMTIAQREKKIS